MPGLPSTDLGDRVADRLHEAVDQRRRERGAGGGVDAAGGDEAVAPAPRGSALPSARARPRASTAASARATRARTSSALRLVALGVLLEQHVAADLLLGDGGVRVVCIVIQYWTIIQYRRGVNPERWPRSSKTSWRGCCRLGRVRRAAAAVLAAWRARLRSVGDLGVAEAQRELHRRVAFLRGHASGRRRCAAAARPSAAALHRRVGERACSRCRGAGWGRSSSTAPSARTPGCSSRWRRTARARLPGSSPSAWARARWAAASRRS